MEKYLDMKSNIDLEKIKEISEEIKIGKIVIFPTETVYGIGGNALDSKAVENLFKIKKRPLNKPISLLVNNINMIEKIAYITDIEYKLIKEFFPGPLTIVLRKKKIIPDIVTSNTDFVGVRMPKNDIALKLIEYSKVPIATSSANISGKPSGTNFESLERDLIDHIDYFIDGGKSEIGLASTVIQILDGKLKVLREGSIKENEIRKLLNS